MPRPPALSLLLVALGLAGCSVLGVRVDDQSSAAVRREAWQVARENGSSPAAVALADAQENKVSESSRASDLLKSAELSAAARPGTPDHDINVAATRSLVALMRERDFAPLPLEDGR
ncbi:MAG: hypothetical protein ACO3XN_08740, partial [Chthoniobacterales bacterium]